MGRLDDSIGFCFREFLDALVALVDLDLSDIAAVAQHVPDRAGRPGRLAVQGRYPVRSEPVAHRAVAPGINVGLEHLRDEVGLVRVGIHDVRLSVQIEAEGHETAVPHAFFRAHPHLRPHLLPGLLSLIGFGGHQHGFHEAA
ncbi:MAG: hypothetical protein JO316_07775 [Abitibacteriaceae bacterium]|nr:hypothetical protein [Abditibacteriaceae bacterium]